MIKLNFSIEDVDHLQKSSISHPHPFVRRKALVLLLKSKGISHRKICDTVGICGNTLRKYCKCYQDKGLVFVEEIHVQLVGSPEIKRDFQFVFRIEKGFEIQLEGLRRQGYLLGQLLIEVLFLPKAQVFQAFL